VVLAQVIIEGYTGTSREAIAISVRRSIRRLQIALYIIKNKTKQKIATHRAALARFV
jgi:hypothetical protein